MQEYGLPLEDGNILWYGTDQKGGFLKEGSVRDETKQLLSSCSAVICYNDEIATRVVSFLNRQGISVPGDVAIVSFDNSQYSEMSIPRISSLSHQQYNVGRLAAELLFRHLRGEPCESQLAPWFFF